MYLEQNPALDTPLVLKIKLQLYGRTAEYSSWTPAGILMLGQSIEKSSEKRGFSYSLLSRSWS